ncbi:fibronectin type III domain-containing protein [Thermogemmata fonticola]|uniref:Fibronectin type-III domain-containing protein n=1 Tax=Thermogemmata fonticola TaxID=2755323 RepID=A0A7V8VE79_9BACT|nr:hypothetical protein [Thermogemmata fonticola]MBA2226152.1 hypothetical protein [Thermogemmata fonticola]
MFPRCILMTVRAMSAAVLMGALPPSLLSFPAPEADPPGAPRREAHPVNCWVLQSPRPGQPVPDFPYEGSGGYDPLRRRWIHHGGHDGIPQGFQTFLFDLESGRWEQRFPPTSPPGACCVDGANVFDRVQGVFVRFPGGSLGHGYQWSRGVKLKESHVWIYDPQTNEFINMRPEPYGMKGRQSAPIGGLNSSGTYDPEHELVISFGGQSSSGAHQRLFAYDVYSNQLYILPAKQSPPARDGAALAYDRSQNRLVLFGSQYLVDERTWLYDFQTENWEALKLEPHPPAHKVTRDYCTIPRMAYDSRHQVLLLVVWKAQDGHETWVLDLKQRQWRKMNPVQEPSPSKSRSRNLDYDEERNLFILETSSDKTNRPEIWTYRYAEQKQEKQLSAPQSLRALTDEEGGVQLAWSAVGGAERYRIYRAVADKPWQTQFTLAGQTDSCTWRDRAPSATATTWYRITAVDAQGRESPPSRRARSDPPAPRRLTASATDKGVSLQWPAADQADIVGWHVYRGRVIPRTVRKGQPAAWRDNDPEYDQPQFVEVQDIVQWQRLTREPVRQTHWHDTVTLRQKSPDSDYPWTVYAYVLRAVNRLGRESGPSPYVLTIPSEPRHVLCREVEDFAEIQWEPPLEKNVIGYHIYMLRGTWEIIRLTDQPIRETRYRYRVGRQRVTRFWVTAVDHLGQEGQPSSPAWFGRAYRGFFEGDWHQ